jgi:hypothetical protein
MKTIRLLISVLIIVAGPIVTVYLYETVEVSATVCSVIIRVLIMSGVTAVVSTVVTFILKHPLLATFASVVISGVLLVLLLLAYIFCMSASRAVPGPSWWLRAIILFLIPLGFPTVLSVSYGTGRIVRDLRAFRDTRVERSQDFVKRLI